MKIILIFIIIASLGFTNTAFSETQYAVIISSQNTQSLSLDNVKRIFFGRIARFADGTKAIPINQTIKSDARKQFEQVILQKNPRKMQQYWASMVFSAKYDAPEEAQSDNEMLERISENNGSIGYINKNQLDDRVRVLFLY